MSKRHTRNHFFLADRGRVVGDVERVATPSEMARDFRFSQLVPGTPPGNSDALLVALKEVMTGTDPVADGHIPAGFTYLGQFVDHDLTRDRTQIAFGEHVPFDKLTQGRSPALDLDSLYGDGPGQVGSSAFFMPDGIHFRMGITSPSGPTPEAQKPLDGFDLPRRGAGGPSEEARMALIGDERNDENLAVAQTHLAFLRFHNAVADLLASRGVPSSLLFEKAREMVVKHYQFMLKSDFLPRIIVADVLDDVFSNGRKFFEVGSTDAPTMPLEFSVAAYRLGHSMIRDKYDWNAVFGPNGAIGDFGTLKNLFQFSGTSGNLNPGTDIDNPVAGTFETLPTNWVADWTRLFDFAADGLPELAPEPGHAVNMARPIDIRLTDPLKTLPPGSFGARGAGIPDGDPRRNLAFRNLVRGKMVHLATAQQIVTAMRNMNLDITPLTSAQILGEDFDNWSEDLKNELVTETPLWFYILREAGLNEGRLGPIGGRIVAEVFHRAMEGSRISLLRDPFFRPELGREAEKFRMTDLLTLAYKADRGELRPLSPGASRPSLESTRPVGFP